MPLNFVTFKSKTPTCWGFTFLETRVKGFTNPLWALEGKTLE